MRVRALGTEAPVKRPSLALSVEFPARCRASAGHRTTRRRLQDGPPELCTLGTRAGAFPRAQVVYAVPAATPCVASLQ